MAGGTFPGVDLGLAPGRGGEGTGTFPGQDEGQYPERGVDATLEFPGASDGSDAGGGGGGDQPSLTTTGSILGDNFEDLDEDNIAAKLTALGLFAGTGSVVTNDPTYGKVIEFDSQFDYIALSGYIAGGGAGPASARYRAIFKPIGFDPTFQNGEGLFNLNNINSMAAQGEMWADESMDFFVADNRDMGVTYDENQVAGLGTEVAAEEWKEVILEVITEDDAPRVNFYLNAVGAERIVRGTAVADPGADMPYTCDAYAFQFNQAGPWKMRLALFEVTDASIPIDEMGT